MGPCELPVLPGAQAGMLCMETSCWASEDALHPGRHIAPALLILQWAFEIQNFLILHSLSKSTELKSRRQEVHKDIGVDTEIAGSLLALAIYLEDTGWNGAFSDKPANKCTW